MAKIRNGFISNSSSSSFIVALSDISSQDRDKLLDFPNHSSQDYNWHGATFKYHDRWDIFVSDDGQSIEGFTTMDNDDLDEYMKEHHIDDSKFKYNSF